MNKKELEKEYDSLRHELIKTNMTLKDQSQQTFELSQKLQYIQDNNDAYRSVMGKLVAMINTYRELLDLEKIVVYEKSRNIYNTDLNIMTMDEFKEFEKKLRREGSFK
jgi:septal ring factor EnvC (AmiA/AmiB activator)